MTSVASYSRRVMFREGGASGHRRPRWLLDHPRMMTLSIVAATSFVVNIVASVAADIPLSERRSGYQDMSSQTRAMQDDDTVNPGTLWVLEGEALWTAKVGPENRACADCHGDAQQSMKSVAAHHPAYDSARGTPVTLEQRINLCRGERQKATPFAYESKELLALAAYVARQSRGLPIAPDERLARVVEDGRAIFQRRQGQLDLSCAQCHDDNWDKRLAGNRITQGQPTGYPIYRLEWQTLGSLQRRLRNCLVGMRAQPYAYGSPEYVALETFLMWRARGLPLESPGVRP
jgi:sulfur-oxidizing protein SoxA